MLLSKVSGTNNSIYQERYLTVSVHKKNIDEARTYFARVGTDIITHLSKLSSIGEVGAGKGLIRCSGNLVPFENSFPKNTKLYRLMTTKPGEC